MELKDQNAIGPIVHYTELGDGHFEPDWDRTLDLHISNFTAWDQQDLETVRSALASMASIEAEPWTYCGQKVCDDPIYLEGLAQYIKLTQALGAQAPYDPLIITSALDHGLCSTKSAVLSKEVATLFSHPSTEIRDQALSYVSELITRTGVDGRLGQLYVTENSVAALINELPSLNSTDAKKILHLLCRIPSSVELPENTAELIHKTVTSHTESSVFDQAAQYINLRRDAFPADMIDSVLEHIHKNSSLDSYAAGIAAAHFLSKDPHNEDLRNRIQSAAGKAVYWVIPEQARGYNLDGFTQGLLYSGELAAVAAAMVAVDRSVGALYNSNPLSLRGLRWVARKLASTVDPDVNTIMYCLDVRCHPEAAWAGVFALARHGGKAGINYLENQKKSPPVENRKITIERALKQVR